MTQLSSTPESQHRLVILNAEIVRRTLDRNPWQFERQSYWRTVNPHIGPENSLCIHIPMAEAGLELVVRSLAVMYIESARPVGM